MIVFYTRKQSASFRCTVHTLFKNIFEFWQYWRNTEDADVDRFLKLFTTLPMDEINRLAALKGAEANEAKKVLATEATALVHGRDAAEKAAETARQTFEQGTTAADLPSVDIPTGQLAEGVGILSLMVLAGLAGSNGEARRHIKAGALKLNNAAVTSHEAEISADDIQDGQIKLSVGKKRHALLRAI